MGHHSNTVIGTLAVDGYSEEGTLPVPSPPRPLLAVPNVTAHPSTASVPTSYYSMWHYNCGRHLGFQENVNTSGLDKNICTKYYGKMDHGHAEMTT